MHVLALLGGALQGRIELFVRPSAPVAQLDRACASGAQGQRFESSRARHCNFRFYRCKVFAIQYSGALNEFCERFSQAVSVTCAK